MNDLYSFSQAPQDALPNVNSFWVYPYSIIAGGSTNAYFTASDDVGLLRAELWRANDIYGQPYGWSKISTTSISGESYTGSFTDTPPLIGSYWYGVHVVDNSGNPDHWNDERNSQTGFLPGVYGPLKVIVSQCASGACCDTETGRFRPSSYKCQEDVTTDYGCPWGTGCGADVGVRHQDRYCTGSSADCGGSLAWDTWTVADSCSSNHVCTEDGPTCSFKSGCTSAMVVHVPKDFPSISQAAGWISGFGKPGVVLVSPGTYNEHHMRLMSGVDIVGADRETTIINGLDSDYTIECANDARLSGFTINGEGVVIHCGASSTISNNIITGGSTGILVENGASPIIRNNIIKNVVEGVYSVGGSSPTIQNNVISSEGAANIGIDLTEGSSATITNNVIDSKGPSPWGWGIYIDSSSATIKNNIFTNMPCGINDPQMSMISYIPYPTNEWVIDSGIAYNDFWNVQGEICSGSSYWSPPIGTGQKAVNPSFVDASSYDFRLQDGSQCIDAGDPATTYNDVYLPPSKGTARNDMGAYGGPYAKMPNTPSILSSVTTSPFYVRSGTTVTVSSVADDLDGDAIRLVCGTSSGATDLCMGPYAASNPSCSFVFSSLDTSTKTIFCRSQGSPYSNEKTDTVFGDNAPPSLSVSNSSITARDRQDVMIEADASDADSGLKSVRIYMNNTLKEDCATSPCYHTDTYFAGSHEYYAEAYDNANNSVRDPASGTKSFYVLLGGDTNTDCTVNVFDLAQVGLCFGQDASGGCQKADLIADGIINIFDLATVGVNYGRSC